MLTCWVLQALGICVLYLSFCVLWSVAMPHCQVADHVHLKVSSLINLHLLGYIFHNRYYLKSPPAERMTQSFYLLWLTSPAILQICHQKTESLTLSYIIVINDAGWTVEQYILYRRPLVKGIVLSKLAITKMGFCLKSPQGLMSSFKI